MLSQSASVEELLQHRCFDDLFDDDGKVKYRRKSCSSSQRVCLLAIIADMHAPLPPQT